jgi:hypothetical protein
VAFVALSEEAEYAYAWLFASIVTRGVAPPETAASSGSRQRRPAEVTGAELLV